MSNKNKQALMNVSFFEKKKGKTQINNTYAERQTHLKGLEEAFQTILKT